MKTFFASFIVLVGMCLGMVSVIANPAVAGASLPCEPTHCYSIANSGTVTLGRYAELYVAHGNANWTVAGFVDQELWTLASSTSTWVEVGYTYGPVAGVSTAGPNWFWADNRPGLGYFEHIPSTPSPTNYFGQYIAVATSYLGSNTWGIYIAGSLVGYSTSQPGGSVGAQAGVEAFRANSASYLATSVAGNLKWQDYLGGWHSGFLDNATFVDPNAFGGWYVTDVVWVDSFN